MLDQKIETNADMLVSKYGLDLSKTVGTATDAASKWWSNRSPMQQNAMIGAGLGSATGGVVGLLGKRPRASDVLRGAVAGGLAGGGLGAALTAGKQVVDPETTPAQRAAETPQSVELTGAPATVYQAADAAQNLSNEPIIGGRPLTTGYAGVAAAREVADRRRASAGQPDYLRSRRSQLMTGRPLGQLNTDKYLGAMSRGPDHDYAPKWLRATAGKVDQSVKSHLSSLVSSGRLSGLELQLAEQLLDVGSRSNDALPTLMSVAAKHLHAPMQQIVDGPTSNPDSLLHRVKAQAQPAGNAAGYADEMNRVRTSFGIDPSSPAGQALPDSYNNLMQKRPTPSLYKNWSSGAKRLRNVGLMGLAEPYIWGGIKNLATTYGTDPNAPPSR